MGEVDERCRGGVYYGLSDCAIERLNFGEVREGGRGGWSERGRRKRSEEEGFWILERILALKYPRFWGRILELIHGCVSWRLSGGVAV